MVCSFKTYCTKSLNSFPLPFMVSGSIFVSIKFGFLSKGEMCGNDFLTHYPFNVMILNLQRCVAIIAGLLIKITLKISDLFGHIRPLATLTQHARIQLKCPEQRTLLSAP